jgi:hypothetical protein
LQILAQYCDSNPSIAKFRFQSISSLQLILQHFEDSSLFSKLSTLSTSSEDGQPLTLSDVQIRSILSAPREMSSVSDWWRFLSLIAKARVAIDEACSFLLKYFNDPSLAPPPFLMDPGFMSVLSEPSFTQAHNFLLKSLQRTHGLDAIMSLLAVPRNLTPWLSIDSRMLSVNKTTIDRKMISLSL